MFDVGSEFKTAYQRKAKCGSTCRQEAGDCDRQYEMSKLMSINIQVLLSWWKGVYDSSKISFIVN